jgi:hypothetical protein
MVVDSNAYLGSWPNRRLRCTDPGCLEELASAHGIDLCMVSGLDAIFHSDYVDANRRLERELEGHPLLRHLPVANPSSPMAPGTIPPMVRLVPSHQGYSPVGRRCGRLLGQLESSGGRLFISMRMRDQRLMSPLLMSRELKAKDVSAALARHQSLPTVINNCKSGEIRELMERTGDNVLFDCAWSLPIGFIEETVDSYGDGRLVFGSNVPLHYYDCSLLQIRLADIAGSSKRNILAGNLKRFLGSIL